MGLLIGASLLRRFDYEATTIIECSEAKHFFVVKFSVF